MSADLADWRISGLYLEDAPVAVSVVEMAAVLCPRTGTVRAQYRCTCATYTDDEPCAHVLSEIKGDCEAAGEDVLQVDLQDTELWDPSETAEEHRMRALRFYQIKVLD